jgi:hypothetical protein
VDKGNIIADGQTNGGKGRPVMMAVIDEDGPTPHAQRYAYGTADQKGRFNLGMDKLGQSKQLRVVVVAASTDTMASARAPEVVCRLDGGWSCR